MGAVPGIADHPAFRNVVRSYAELFDLQHDPAYKDILTYPSPLSGEPVGTSFLPPATMADLVKRRDSAGRRQARGPDRLHSQRTRPLR